MRVLLDQGTPLPLRQHLLHHAVRTAFQEGWATLAKGDLLTAAEWRGLEAHVHLVVAAIDRAAKGSYDEVEIPIG